MRFWVEPIMARPPKRLRATLAACADSKANWLTPGDVGTNASLMQRLLQFDCVSLGLQRAVCRNATWEKRKLSPEIAAVRMRGAHLSRGLSAVSRALLPAQQLAGVRGLVEQVDVARQPVHIELAPPGSAEAESPYRIVSHSHDRRPGQRSCVHRFPYLLVAFGGGRSD